MTAPAGNKYDCSADEIWRPGRLFSLGDIMQRFRASSFSAAIGALVRAASFIEGFNVSGMPEDIEADRQIVLKELTESGPEFEELPLSRVVKLQLERTKGRVEHANSEELIVLLRELHNNLLAELTSAWFLMIKADRREFYEMRAAPFGDNVASAFGDANRDIAAASRCYALDEWTACVFHLMRALEHGLRIMAKKVGLSAEAMAHENWKNIIDQVEKKIREIEGEPKSPEKIERTRVFSAAAVQFRYFKDAWRNHVSHSHASYDEREADTIYTHVKAFMGQMADAVSAAQSS